MRRLRPRRLRDVASVRTHLLALAVVVSLPVAGVFVWLLGAAYEQAMELAAAQVRLSAADAVSRVDMLMRQHEEIMERLQERPLVRALDRDQCDPLLREYRDMRSEVSQVVLIGEAGELICAETSGIDAQVAGINAEPLDDELQRRDFHIGAAWMHPSSGRWLLPLSKPVFDANGVVRGLLRVHIDLLAMNPLVFRGLPPGGLVEVIDLDRRLLLRSVDPDPWIGREIEAARVETVRRHEMGSFVDRRVDGDPWLFAPLRLSSLDWQVVAGVPESQALAAHRAVLLRTVTLIVVLMGVTTVLVWLMANRVASPLQMLAVASARVASGSRSVRVALQGPREVRELASHFNQMLDARQRDEEALRVGRERLQRALDASNLALWDYDVVTGAVYLSDSWSQMLGGPKIETQTDIEALADSVPPEDLTVVQGALTAALKGPEAPYRVEHRVRRHDGSVFWVVSVGRVVERNDDGRALRLVGTNRDITERVKAEETRRGLEAQLRESQKMEAIGTLAGGIAHDFNSILGAIGGHVLLARESIGTHHAAQGSLEQVLLACQRARSLVGQILAFSRRQAQQLQVQPMAPLVKETLELLQVTLPKSLVLDACLTDDPLQARVDATQMQQVVMNLCTNAWQALPAGRGRVRVGLDAEIADRGSALRGNGSPAGRCVHLWVSDDGCGMDEATQERVFEPFYTTKPVGHGTGLGLSVVHGIVTAHGGALHVESSPGNGSTFHVYLPRAESVDEGVSPPAAGSVLPSGGGEHVLCIDDDPVMLLLTEGLLIRAGYRVTICGNPSEVITLLMQPAGEFDVVVTDYNMPGLSGVEVAAAVADAWPQVPVIVASGSITDSLRSEALAAGVTLLVHKENLHVELAHAMHRALASTANEPISAAAIAGVA